jgi:hypothetical protein
VLYRATVEIHGLDLDRGEGEPPIQGLFCTVFAVSWKPSLVDEVLCAQARAFWLRHPFSRLTNRTGDITIRIDAKRRIGLASYVYGLFIAGVSRGCSFYAAPGVERSE